MTQTEFAKRLACSNSHLNGIISGYRTPSLHFAFLIEKETHGEVPATSFLKEPNNIQNNLT